MSVKCGGCGAELQIDKPNEIGYANKLDAKLCQRCFKLKNYGEVIPYQISKENYQLILDQIEKKDAYFYLVVDLFNPEFEYVAILNKILKNNNFSIVCTKKDLMPKQLSEKKIDLFLRENIKRNFDKIFVTSAKKKANIDHVVDHIFQNKAKEVYIIGTANSGKSSLINALISAITLSKEEPIVVGNFPGTTFSNIEIDIDDLKIIDTPGFTNEKSYLNYKNINAVDLIPKAEVKIKTFQLNPDQTIFIDDYAMFEFSKGEKQGFGFAFKEGFDLHRTKTINATNFLENHTKNLVSSKLKTHTFKNIEPWSEIYISGLGYVKISKEGRCDCKITVPEGIKVTVRNSIY